MEIFVPASRRGQVLWYMAATLSIAMTDGDSSSCIPAIDMKGQQMVNKSPGQPLVLKCPVQLCLSELPNVTWCKITGEMCDPVRNGKGIYSGLEEPKKESIYYLKFESVQINDTGYYRCTANHSKLQIMGRTVHIVISGEHVANNLPAINITQTGNTTDFTNQFQTFTLFLYVISFMGGVCVLIITISLLIYCGKHLKVKHGASSQDPAPTAELQFVAMSDNPKNCPHYIQEDTPTSKDIDLATVTNEVTYDNAHMGYKSITYDHVPDHEEENAIVYADLNHNVKMSDFQFIDESEVEYATVHLNESGKNDLLQ
ncbi:hypothetical protein PRIEUP_LOCUS12093, partial [Pristimantis euphronides]